MNAAADHSLPVAVLFPGQGSQAIGMGMGFAERWQAAAALWARLEAAQPGLHRLCREGPEDALRATENTQPALFAAGLVTWAALAAELPGPVRMMAGHSVGEYTALAATGALEPPDGVRLVRRRGELMSTAVRDGAGGMAAVIGADPAAVEALCREISGTIDSPRPALVPANFNAPGQVVVAGLTRALEALQAAAGSKGWRVVPLAVSGPFHSPWMEHAAGAFQEALAKVALRAPATPVVSNVTGEPFPPEPERIRHLLYRQLTEPVQWVMGITYMGRAGVTHFIEAGPGRVLTNLVRRILPQARTFSVAGPEGVKQALAWLKGDQVV